MSGLATFTAPYEGVSRRRACSKCHDRKVRCGFTNSEGPCTNCVASGDRCEILQRKLRSVKRDTLRSPRPVGASSPSTPSVLARLNQISSPFIDLSLPSPRSLKTPDDSIVSEQASSTTPAVSLLESTPRAWHPDEQIEKTFSRRLRTTSFVNRGAILPDVIQGLDKGTNQEEPSMSEVDLQVLKLYHAFDIPPRAVKQSLIDAFFEHCWTWMPVIDQEMVSAESTSPLLLQALFVAGSQMRMNGWRHVSTEDYLRRVKALLDANYESDPLTVIAALCIIQWWNPSAPNVVSSTTSRFWVMCGVNIAQQIGLHRKAPEGTPNIGLRRRIWWSLFARDCLVSSAHGRPRAINLADCTVEPPQPGDFPQPIDQRATCFCFYVSICGILGDLCEMLNRTSTLSVQEKKKVGESLLNWVRSLPDALRLFDRNGKPNSYNFEVSRLHIIFFSATMILFRPPSMFRLDQSCTAAVIASRLACHLFETFLLRDQVHYLSGAYAWHLLVTAIPQLSCALLPPLKKDAEMALDCLEGVLSSLSRKLPSAANNLKNVQLLRNVIRNGPAVVPPTNVSLDPTSFDPISLFVALGGNTVQEYGDLHLVLEPMCDRTPGGSADTPNDKLPTNLDAGSTDIGFNFRGGSSAEFTEPFTGQTDWILDLMNGLSSWR